MHMKRSATWPSYRVTRLGEFSPNERLFSLGNFFENYKSSPHFVLLFP
jgi:hypothetical protein